MPRLYHIVALSAILGLLAVASPALAAPTASPTSDSTVEALHSDAVGTVRLVTDETGAVVESRTPGPFGEARSAEPLTEPGTPTFAGKRRDATSGLAAFGARDYSATLGRFTSVDPVSFQSKALIAPQDFNRYAYGMNNPYKYIDPDGREPKPYRLGNVEFFNSDNGFSDSPYNAPFSEAIREERDCLLDELSYRAERNPVAAQLLFRTPMYTSPDLPLMVSFFAPIPTNGPSFAVPDSGGAFVALTGNLKEDIWIFFHEMGHMAGEHYLKSYLATLPSEQASQLNQAVASDGDRRLSQSIANTFAYLAMDEGAMPDLQYAIAQTTLGYYSKYGSVQRPLREVMETYLRQEQVQGVQTKWVFHVTHK